MLKQLRLPYKILLVIGALLIILRLVLPSILLKYAEDNLNKIPDYNAHIKDIDVHLIQGRYTIKDLQLKKLHSNIPTPFLSAETIDLSIEWRALLKGHFVAEINVNNAQLNFVVDPSGQDEQLSIDKQWQDAVKNLFPLNINRVVISNSQIHLRSYKGKPPFDIYIKNVYAEINNLRKIEDQNNPLSSSISMMGRTLDDAHIGVDVDFDPFAKQPTFDLDADIEELQVPYINDFLKHYTKIEVKQGLFSLYVEAVAKNGKIIGYAKPMIKDLKVFNPQENNISPVEALYKGALQIVAKILENPQQKTVATKIDISGNIDNPDTNIWSIIVNLLRNAFIQALLPQIDNTVKLNDIDQQTK